jgi:hypothetical protein
MSVINVLLGLITTTLSSYTSLLYMQKKNLGSVHSVRHVFHRKVLSLSTSDLYTIKRNLMNAQLVIRNSQHVIDVTLTGDQFIVKRNLFHVIGAIINVH